MRSWLNVTAPVSLRIDDDRRQLHGSGAAAPEWIVDNGSVVDAERFVEAIINYCEGLADVPGIGTARDDIRPGIRTVGFRRTVVIAFAQINATHLTILGVFYGGQDYERHLAGDA